MNKLDPLPEIVKNYIPSFLKGIFYLLLSNVFYMAIPHVIRIAVDGLQENNNASMFLIYCAAGIIGLALAGGILMFLTRENIVVASRHIEYDLRNKMFSHLLLLPSSYYDRASTGDIMNRLTNDLEAVRRMVGPGTMYMSRNISRLLFAIIGMLTINATLTLYALIPFGLIAIAFHWVNSTLREYAKEVQELRSTISSEAQQNFSGIRLLKVFNRETHEKERFANRSNEYREKNLSHAKFMGFTRGIYGVAGEVGIAITLLIGGLWMIENNFTAGDFMAFSAYQFILAWPILSVPRVLNMVQRGLSSLERLQEILAVSPAGEQSIPIAPSGETTVTSTPDKDQSSSDLRKEDEINSEAHDIEFKNLTFSYPGTDTPVLKNISLTIPAGETLGIAGRTGSGKTTLVQLLPRLYPVPDNTLFIGDRDVNNIPLRELRGMISMVPQGDFLFSIQMKENIAYAREQWSLPEVKQAAVNSRMDREIKKFPDGYSQMIGEKGVNLSGGQKQRTSKARALMLQAAIVIMDDSFSNVDSETREIIVKNLVDELSSQTWLFITHNLNLLEKADRIIVLDEGKIAEVGTHEYLLKKEGLYQKLYEEQVIEESFN